MVQSALKKTWVHDCLIKVKTADEAKAESFDNRTVIVAGIPKYLGCEAVVDRFARDAGALVGLELPKENSKLRDLRHEIAN